MDIPQTLNSFLPVKVGSTITIDGTTIHPVLSLQITQAYGDHHHLNLRFYHDIIQDSGTFTLENASGLLGRLAEVVLYNVAGTSGGAQLEAKFVIADVALEQSALGEGILCLTGYSPTWLLDGAPHYESFLGKNLSDIAGIVAKPLEQLRTTLKANPTFTSLQGYVARFGESGWNFLKRLSADTGQWLYFDGRQLVFGSPGKGEPVAVIYGHNCYNLRISLGTAPLPSGYTDYEADGNTSLSAITSVDTGNSGSYAGVAVRKSHELFSGQAVTPPGSLPPSKGAVEAVTQAVAGSVVTDMYRITGESSIWELSVGTLIDVSFKRAGEQYEHTPMRITSVIHSLDVTGAYHNSFEAVRANAEQPPVLAYHKPRTHPMLAEVLSNSDPMGQGRVQVRMKGWVQDHSQQMTDWIRVITPDAGATGNVSQNRGQVFIPEVGDQVMVDYQESNPDKPFVIGSLFHGGNGVEQSNMIRTIMTKSGNKIILNDTEGSVRVQDASGNDVLMDGNGSIIIMASSKDVMITAPERMTLNARNMYINVREDLNIRVGQNQSEFVGKQHSLQSESMVHTIKEDKTLKVGNSLVQTSGEADIQTNKGDLKLRGTGLTVLQGGKDVKVSKG